MDVDTEWEKQAAENWDDWLEDECGIPCLFSPGVAFATMEEALDHDRAQHGFDLVQTRAELGLDFYDTVRLVNFVRREVANVVQPTESDAPVLSDAEVSGVKDAIAADGGKRWRVAGGVDAATAEALLRPVLRDDPYLRELGEMVMGADDWSDDDDDDDDGHGGNAAAVAAAAAAAAAAAPPAAPTASDPMEQLRAENAMLRARVAALEASHADSKGLLRTLFADDHAITPSTDVDNDTYYFDSYSRLAIHREMIEDTVRTDSYRRAIEENAEALFKGKVVLDVGCGTGILSLFACRAGASRVVGVDMSAMAEVAQEVAKVNGYGDVMQVVRGKVEDVELPLRKGEVDVIISEWMGYALLYESMLDSVLVARDRWLRDGGVVLPDCTTVVVEGFSASDTVLGDAATGNAGGVDGAARAGQGQAEGGGAKKGVSEFWDDVYGFDMSPVKSRIPPEQLKAAAALAESGEPERIEPEVFVIDPQRIVTDRCEVRALKMTTMARSEADFEAPFELKLRSHDDAAAAASASGDARQPPLRSRRIAALALSFDTHFSADAGCTTPVTFCTDAASTPTHWQQTLLRLPRECELGGEHSAFLQGTLRIKRAVINPREIEIDVDMHVVNDDGEKSELISTRYHMK